MIRNDYGIFYVCLVLPRATYTWLYLTGSGLSAFSIITEFFAVQIGSGAVSGGFEPKFQNNQKPIFGNQ